MLIPATKERRRSAPAFRRERRPLDREVEVLEHLAEHRFLRSSHIRKLVGFPSERTCQRTLKRLRDMGYVQLVEPRYGDPHAPEDGGTAPAIHALANKGARFLSERYRVWMSSRYNENNRKTAEKKAPVFIDHELHLSDFMVALEIQCRARKDVELIPFYEILRDAPEDTKQQPKQREWPVIVEWKGKRRPRTNVTPDKIFGLRDLRKPEGRNRAYFFLEIDRSTETINPTRKNFPDTTIFHKMLEYAYTFRDDLHKRRYDIHNFRVLFVTGGTRVVDPQERVQSFIETFQKEIRPLDISREGKPVWLKRPPYSMFLFTDDIQLDAHADDYLSVPWKNAKGEEEKLLD